MALLIDLPRFLEDRRQYGDWWDFCKQPDTYTLQVGTVTAGANAGDDVSATVVGSIPRASRLLGGYLAVSANSGGVDANNTSGWVVAIGGSTYLSKTNSADLVNTTPVSYGTPALTDCAAGALVTVAITNGTSADLNSAVCYTTLSLADINNYPAPGLKVIATDGGTVTISDGVKGVVAISPGSADNNEIYMCSSVETVKLASGKTFIGEAYIQFSEANTDDANVFVGFMNAFAADCVVDNGAGPKSTGDYIGIWKVDGGTKWYTGVQSNGTATPTTDTLTDKTAGGTSYQRLRMEVSCESSTRAVAKFWIDGVNVATTHFSYASATEMQFGVGVKNGGANAETLNVDYMGYEQIR